MSARYACLLGVAMLASACTTVRESFVQGGLNRAVFEMQCPREQLQFAGLNVPLDAKLDRVGAQVGVTGCGRRAVYVFAYGAGWVLDSAGQSAAPRSAGAQGEEADEAPDGKSPP